MHSEIDSIWFIADLAKSLRREYLYTANQQKMFADLHETYKQIFSRTLQFSWICAQQRQILNNLILAKPEWGPSVSCQKTNLLNDAKFIDIYQHKELKYPQILGLVELMKFLHESPRILAYCLLLGDRSETLSGQMDLVTGFVINGIYGCVIHPSDTVLFIKLLQMLIEIQIITSDNPRRLLRAGSSSFARLYQRYHESTFAGKIFLKTVLFEPIMFVLMEDALKLEMDPHKIIGIQNEPESQKSCDNESLNKSASNLQIHRKNMVDRMFCFVSKFIESISEGWCLFPSTLRWLSQSMYQFLIQSGISEKDINIILTDMIFTNFICPAILSPHIYGIIDEPLSENTRFNLIQIGQVLQMLALVEFEPIDEKFEDLIAKFDKNCISRLLKDLHQVGDSENFENNIMECHSIIENKRVLVTFDEFIALKNILKLYINQELPINSGDDKRKLERLLEQISDLVDVNSVSQNITDTSLSSNNSRVKSKLKERLSKTKSLNNSPFHCTVECDKKANVHNNNNLHYSGYAFVIPLTMNDDSKLLSEEELLNNIASEISTEILSKPYIEQTSQLTDQGKLANNEQSNCEKNKNLVLTQDDASIGNTSDNLEAVSEAHSNHSVASSLELEEADQNDNDNLSDMISANVSGRGTPNISGRDTPSSQVTEGGGEIQQFTTPQMTKILNKTRSDIEDKFCKFEIKKLIEGDETISIISDTWSTDVLASDSEAIEAGERNFSTPLIPITPLISGDHNFNPLAGTFGQLRLSSLEPETQSESAWSNDAVMEGEDNQTITRRLYASKDKNYDNPKSIDFIGLDNVVVEIKHSKRETLPKNISSKSMKSSNPFSEGTDFEASLINLGNKDVDQVPNSVEEEGSSVEHRRLSSEQRNAKFDSRRNGMMDTLGNYNFLKLSHEFVEKDSSRNCISQASDNVKNQRNPNDTIPVKSTYLVSSGVTRKDQLVNKETPPNLDMEFPMQTSEQRRKNTGTIPKSISFDSSADKISRNISAINSIADANRVPDGLKTQSGFFTKIKLGFKNRRSINANSKLRLSYNNSGHIFSMNSFDGLPPNTCGAVGSKQNEMVIVNETTEDILAKYRRKTSCSSDAATSDSTSNNSNSSKSKNSDVNLRKTGEYIPSDCTTAFVTTKKKLRFVLSSMAIFSCDYEQCNDTAATPLLIYLRILHAQALSSQNLQQLSCISELFRCIKVIDAGSQQLLLKELQNDMQIRQSYIHYLMNCHQSLLLSIDNLNSFDSHLQLESESSIRNMVMICVRMFLEKRELIVNRFYDEFVQLNVVDEKRDILQDFLNSLMDDLRTDSALSCMTDWQIIAARSCMECILLHRLYYSVLFPNDDGDISRDEVLFQHIKQLSRTITPAHAHLRIPSMYLNEAPWPYAQRQLSFISAYKTPLNKVECVIKCIKSLLNLLSMGTERVVAADDIIPVLIYVIIKANPPNLLSTIEYVNCFYGDKLSGETQYWWTQFCSAITFIKTMDYNE